MQNYSENIIVGNGIMAKQLMFELKNHFSDISCISSLDFAPPSSLSTTSINCLRGTEKGVSVLGDLLFDSHQEFVKFFSKFSPPGIYKTLEVQTWIENSQTHAKWLRRYKGYNSVSHLRFSNNKLNSKLACVEVEAFVIDTDIFFRWYDEQLSKVNFIDGFIIEIVRVDEGYSLTCSSGRVYCCKRLFLCTSYLSHHFRALCIDEEDQIELSKQKQVYGSYLSHDIDLSIDYGLDFTNSFSLSFNFTRLIYRKGSNQLLMSLSDKNKNAFINNKNQIVDTFEELTRNLHLTKLPDFSNWSLIQGIRSKGFRRIPFCREVNQNLFIVSGLYKNAFSFSFLFSQKILQKIVK